jgi:hypothetical protein
MLTCLFCFVTEIQAEDASLLSNKTLPSKTAPHGDPSFSVIEEFNYWRTQPELAEAVAAIKALTALIRRSEATTMMGLEIELKKASEVLKVGIKDLTIDVVWRAK